MTTLAASVDRPLCRLARVQQHVVDLLAENGLRQVAELQHQSHLPKSSVYAALRTLRRAGLVDRQGDTVFDWYLTAYGQRHVTTTRHNH